MLGSYLKIKNLNRIFKLIENGENIAVVSLPGSGRTRLASILNTKEILESNLDANKLTKTIFIYIDQSVGIENAKMQILFDLQGYFKSNNLQEAVKELVDNQYKLNLIIDNFKYDKDFLELINVLKSSLHYNFRVISLSLLSDFIELEKDLSLVSAYSHLFHNIIEIGYLNPTDVLEWLKGRCIELDLNLEEETLVNINNFCGGVPRLLKNYLRTYRKYNNTTEVENSNEMLLTIKILWEQFSVREKHFLKKLVLTKKVDDLDSEIYKYFKEMNIITNDKIYGEWIYYIVRKNLSSSLEIRNNLVLLDNYDITNQFSIKEIEFLSKLDNSKLVDRDTVFKLLGDEYTDWSIDKFVSRLRHKLEVLGIEGYVETVKGKGFKKR